MKYTVRAVLAVALLIGFYLFALAVVAALVFLVVEAAMHGLSGAALIKIAVFVAIVAYAVIKGLVTRGKRDSEPGGLLIEESAQPGLWAQVRELADDVGTRMPDEIRLVPEVNAAVSEDSRLLGLISGTRRLYIGVPLLIGMSRDQVRSVLAHELGHYSGRHTALGPVTYRGKEAIARVLGNLGEDSWVGKLLGLYGKLYYAVAHSVSRQQELEADEYSARLAGRDAAASALSELPGLGAAWGYFVESYSGMGYEEGLRPSPLFDGFASLVTDPVTRERMDKIRDEAPEPARSIYDSHPPIHERVAAIRASQAPDIPPGDDPSDPGTTLLDDPAGAFAAFEEQLYAESKLRPAGWDEVAVAQGTGVVASNARALSGVLQEAGRPRTIRAAVERLSSGGATGLLDVGEVDQDRAIVARLVGDAAANALVTEGRAGFALSWADSMHLVGADGEELDTWSGAGEATEEFLRNLSALGVDVDAELPTPPPTQPSN